MDILNKSKNNVYEKIVEHYKKYISLGIIKNGEKLPSCRNLASELGINPNTVEKAYSVLESQNYITSVAKKGFYVSYDEHEDSQKIYVYKLINEIKNMGIKKDELINLIKDVYKEEEK